MDVIEGYRYTITQAADDGFQTKVTLSDALYPTIGHAIDAANKQVFIQGLNNTAAEIGTIEDEEIAHGE